jgi:transcriptional regulator with XRE-family HTH domain
MTTVRKLKRDDELSKKELGVFIKNARGELSQAALGKKARVDSGQIGKIELGQYTGSPETLIALAHALGYERPGVLLDVLDGLPPTPEQSAEPLVALFKDLDEDEKNIILALLRFFQSRRKPAENGVKGVSGVREIFGSMEKEQDAQDDHQNEDENKASS